MRFAASAWFSEILSGLALTTRQLCGAQDVNRSISAGDLFLPCCPTAQIASLEAETPDKKPFPSGAAGLDMTAHLLPFQCSTRECEPFESPAPTAQMSDALTAVMP